MKNKIYLMATLAFAVLSISATISSQSIADKITKVEEAAYQNLKILPKDISEEELKAIMKDFNKALGVKCNHCHAPKNDGSEGLDFASDSKHEKLITRGMMQMTQEINENYFYKYQESDVKINQVSCITCHNKEKTPVK